MVAPPPGNPVPSQHHAGWALDVPFFPSRSRGLQWDKPAWAQPAFTQLRCPTHTRWLAGVPLHSSMAGSHRHHNTCTPCHGGTSNPWQGPILPPLPLASVRAGAPGVKRFKSSLYKSNWKKPHLPLSLHSWAVHKEQPPEFIQPIKPALPPHSAEEP